MIGWMDTAIYTAAASVFTEQSEMTSEDKMTANSQSPGSP